MNKIIIRKNIVMIIKNLKKSRFAWKQGLALPLYVGIKDNEIDYIVSQLKDHICN